MTRHSLCPHCQRVKAPSVEVQAIAHLLGQHTYCSCPQEPSAALTHRHYDPNPPPKPNPFTHVTPNTLRSAFNLPSTPKKP